MDRAGHEHSDAVHAAPAPEPVAEPVGEQAAEPAIADAAPAAVSEAAVDRRTLEIEVIEALSTVYDPDQNALFVGTQPIPKLFQLDLPRAELGAAYGTPRISQITWAGMG